MTRLILWRHGQTEWNAQHRVQGQTDVDLSELGHAQAAATAPLLAALRPDVLVSSDLRRAADTIAPLAALTGLPVRYDVRLRERHFGQWQSHTLDEVERRWPDAYTRWRAGQAVDAAEVEDVEDVTKRMVDALQEIATGNAGRTVVIATHGGAARFGACGLLGWPAPLARSVGPLRNCHWTELRHDTVRGWQLMAHNAGGPGGSPDRDGTPRGAAPVDGGQPVAERAEPR